MRCSEPVATFDDAAFQCYAESLDDTTAEPLRTNVTPLGHICAPLLGTYMETYEPVVPLILLQTGFSPEKVPEELMAAIPSSDVSLSIQVHGQVPMNPCQHFQCDSYSEINVVFHSFFFPTVTPWAEEGNKFKVIQCGLFEANNVVEVHQNAKDEKCSGLSFNRLALRDCIIHGGAYSPCNCQIDRIPDSEWMTFWSVATEGGKTCVSFHAICGNDAIEAKMRQQAKECQTIRELIQQVHVFPKEFILASRRAFK